MRSGVQNSNPNLRAFLAQNSWTNLSLSMPVSLYACRSASPESLSAHIVDIDTKTVTRAKTGARLAIGVACLPVHSLATSCYTSNVKLECRSAAGLCFEELHAINDAFGKHLEYENTHKKRLTFFFFQFGHSCLTGLMSGSPCSFTCQAAVLRKLLKNIYIQ